MIKNCRNNSKQCHVVNLPFETRTRAAPLMCGYSNKIMILPILYLLGIMFLSLLDFIRKKTHSGYENNILATAFAFFTILSVDGG
jgi:hypothetical protein